MTNTYKVNCNIHQRYKLVKNIMIKNKMRIKKYKERKLFQLLKLKFKDKNKDLILNSLNKYKILRIRII